jgi:hypothetical protein
MIDLSTGYYNSSKNIDGNKNIYIFLF